LGEVGVNVLWKKNKFIMYKLSFICKERYILHIWGNHWHPILRASCVFNIFPSGGLYPHIYKLRDSLILLIRTKQCIVLKLQILAVNYIVRLRLFFSIFYSFDSSLITTVMNGIANAIFIVVVKLEWVSDCCRLCIFHMCGFFYLILLVLETTRVFMSEMHSADTKTKYSIIKWK
jgi:hypothetical protein